MLINKNTIYQELEKQKAKHCGFFRENFFTKNSKNLKRIVRSLKLSKRNKKHTIGRGSPRRTSW